MLSTPGTPPRLGLMRGVLALAGAGAASADFFVDSVNGSDSNDGLSADTPKKTLAAISSSVTAGKKLALKRGSRFKESFTIGADGVSILAYGDAPVVDADGYVTNAPIIDGGEAVTGWTAYTGGASTAAFSDDFTDTAGTELDAHGAWTIHPHYPPTTLVVTDTNRVRRSSGTGLTTAYYATAVPASADYYVSADFVFKSVDPLENPRVCARMDTVVDTMYAATWNLSGNTLSVAKFVGSTGTTLGTPVAVTAPAVGSTHNVRLEVEGTTLRVFLDDTQVYSVTDSSITAVGRAGIRSGSGSSGSSTNTTGCHFDNFETGPLSSGTPVNTYQAALTTETRLVDFGGEYAPLGGTADTLLDGEWYWASDVLYIRSDAGSPTNVIAATRDNAIDGFTHNNVTISGIAVEHTNDRAIVFTGGANAQLKGVMAQRTGGGTGQNGVLALTSHDAPTLRGCIVRNVGSDGVYMNGVTAPVVTGCRIGPVFGPSADCMQIDSADGVSVGSTITNNWFSMMGTVSPKGCLILFGDDHVVTGNYFEGGNNFGVSCPGNGFVVSDNVFYQTGSGGAVRIIDNPPGVVLDDHLVEHNVMIDCLVGILVDSSGSQNRTNQRYVANTIANLAVAPLAGKAQVWSNKPIGGEFKDNILWNASGSGASLVVASVTGTWDSDYNLVGPEATGFINFQSTAYDTLAAYAAAKSRDSHSIHADPQFVNLGGHAEDGSDYVLEAASPARAAGVVVVGIVLEPRMGAK